GQGPGQFLLPHGIAVAADGRVFVCDRENDRIQIFSPDGEYVSEWTDTRRPTHLVFDAAGRAHVSELWWQPGQTSPRYGPAGSIRSGPGSVHDSHGHLLARGGGPAPRQLRRAARHRGGLARGRLRERGDLDLRGQPGPRPAGDARVPEVRVRALSEVRTAERLAEPFPLIEVSGPPRERGRQYRHQAAPRV